MSLLEATLAAIAPIDPDLLAEAEARQLSLTKPAGSLGLLESVGNRLSAISGQCPPPLPEPAVVGVFAGDHGVVDQGVTPWPQDITVAMLMNMAGGGAAVNVLARQMGASVLLTDVGVAGEHPAHPAIRDRLIRRGTRDMSVEAAMTREEAVAALEVGIEAATEAVRAGARCLATGEMGIGNTTPASALISVLTGAPVPEVTGAGAGADDDMLAHKVEVISRALSLHEPDSSDPLGVLAAVGGLEHAAIAGFILGGAANRVPVVLDGVIACSAALVAVGLAPDAAGYLLSGHAGVEPGIRTALRQLGLQPLVDLGLRLGEGTGAVLALPIVTSAARVLSEMATFDDLGSPPRGRVTLVLGGARSGKSTWAESRLEGRPAVDYVATSDGSPDDPEWSRRVEAHRSRRPAHWRTLETTDVTGVLMAPDDAPVLVDCLAVWLTRALDVAGAWDDVPGWRDFVDNEITILVEAVRRTRREVILVSNEVGLGVVPATASGRTFRDGLGRLNARLAAACDEVWMCEAGVARRLR